WQPSSSQTSGPNVKNSTGQRWNGAKASTESTPSTTVNRARRHPERPATHVARRSNGLPALLSMCLSPSRGEARARGTVPSRRLVLGRLCTGAAVALLWRDVDPQALDPARIGLEHLELDAARVADEFPARRDAPGNGKHETAERVDLLLEFLRDELEPELLLEILDRCARVGDEAEFRIGADQGLVLDVVLVGDLADHLLDQVLDGDEPVRPAIFVDHERKMQSRHLHLEQEIEHRHRTGYVEDLARDADARDAARKIDLAEIERRVLLGFGCGGDPRHQIADMDHAARVI